MPLSLIFRSYFVWWSFHHFFLSFYLSVSIVFVSLFGVFVYLYEVYHQVKLSGHQLWKFRNLFSKELNNWKTKTDKIFFTWAVYSAAKADAQSTSVFQTREKRWEVQVECVAEHNQPENWIVSLGKCSCRGCPPARRHTFRRQCELTVVSVWNVCTFSRLKSVPMECIRICFLFARNGPFHEFIPHSYLRKVVL